MQLSHHFFLEFDLSLFSLRLEKPAKPHVIVCADKLPSTKGGGGGERERKRKRKGEEEEERIEASRELLAKFLPHISPNCHKTNLSTDPGSATEYSTSCVLALPTTILSISSRLVSVRLVR